MGNRERELNALERQRQALELRKAGVPYAKIAEQLQYKDRSSAFRSVQAALKKTLQEPADELRTLELERLDALMLALWPQARSGNQGAVDRVLRIMERRARLLGLDAPTRTDLTTKGKELSQVLVFLPDNGRDDHAPAGAATAVPGQPG